MTVFHLSLVSHTNVGKTTLARTLLRKDVGEVLDAAHVTELASDYSLLATADGDELRLWDTPGFGDSARLARRLQGSTGAIGWFLTQVWDRFTDRPFFSSQQALRNVRDRADVILYLANAAEDPSSLGYLDAELQILGWLQKPVIVLLNQVGPPRPADEENAERERWRRFLADRTVVRDVLAFDAFARCWVQEGTLLAHVAAVLPADQRPAFERVASAWRARNEETFRQSARALADQVATIALDAESVPVAGLGASARSWLRSLVSGGLRTDERMDRAMQALAERADTRIRAATDALIQLHGLSGRAAAEVEARLAGDFALERAASRGRAGVLGAAVSGALGGLAADLASGGLTLGGGMIVGAVLGAAGAAGVAHGYNLLRGTDQSSVRWNEDMLDRLVVSASLRYLAVAHFGRGRGEYVAGEYPPHWRPLVERVVLTEQPRLAQAWALAADGALPGTLRAALERSLLRVWRETLATLYPDADADVARRDPPGAPIDRAPAAG